MAKRVVALLSSLDGPAGNTWHGPGDNAPIPTGIFAGRPGSFKPGAGRPPVEAAPSDPVPASDPYIEERRKALELEQRRHAAFVAQKEAELQKRERAAQQQYDRANEEREAEFQAQLEAIKAEMSRRHAAVEGETAALREAYERQFAEHQARAQQERALADEHERQRRAAEDLRQQELIAKLQAQLEQQHAAMQRELAERDKAYHAQISAQQLAIERRYKEQETLRQRADEERWRKQLLEQQRRTQQQRLLEQSARRSRTHSMGYGSQNRRHRPPVDFYADRPLFGDSPSPGWHDAYDSPHRSQYRDRAQDPLDAAFGYNGHRVSPNDPFAGPQAPQRRRRDPLLDLDPFSGHGQPTADPLFEEDPFTGRKRPAMGLPFEGDFYTPERRVERNAQSPSTNMSRMYGGVDLFGPSPRATPARPRPRQQSVSFAPVDRSRPQQRELDLAIPCVEDDKIEGANILRYLGPVHGSMIHELRREPLDSRGKREYRHAVELDREEALAHLQGSAFALGADAVVCVKFAEEAVSHHEVELVAYGKAVKLDNVPCGDLSTPSRPPEPTPPPSLPKPKRAQTLSDLAASLTAAVETPSKPPAASRAPSAPAVVPAPKVSPMLDATVDAVTDAFDAPKVPEPAVAEDAPPKEAEPAVPAVADQLTASPKPLEEVEKAAQPQPESTGKKGKGKGKNKPAVGNEGEEGEKQKMLDTLEPAATDKPAGDAAEREDHAVV